MAPAGYWPQLHAAIEAGADAVYFGLKHFTARAKVGFVLAELRDVLSTLHRRGVKGYVTFNTLIFDHELEVAARTIAAIVEAGADALIIQDVGIAELAHRIAPDQVLHGSTQMSITSAEGVRLAQEFGVSRVTLARELSLDDIRAIRAQTGCELEIFVHGALCVSYSGQCFSSEAWGGRSANRGQCAQACRLPYDLLVDGEQEPLGAARYLLSPGDLYALRQMPEIVRIGVAAIKIEGRYKDPDYVALTTRAYRQAVDQAWAGLPPGITAAEEAQLAQVFSRGLGPYFLTGTNHQAVVAGRTPRHRGVLMGRVVGITGERVTIAPEPGSRAAPLKPGDGLVFDAADWRSPQEPEEGGRVYQVVPLRRGQIELRFGNGALDPARIRPGDLVWRSHDPDLDKFVRPYLEAATPLHKQPVDVRVTAHEGAPLVAEWSLARDPQVRVTVTSPGPLGGAEKRALTADLLREQFGRLGNTAYALAEVTLDLCGRPFAPASLLNDLRRQAVEPLAARQAAPRAAAVTDPAAVLERARAQVTPAAASGLAPQLHLLVRTPEQLDAALDVRPASITLDYLNLYGLRPAIEQIRARGLVARVAAPRVLKPGEAGIVHFLLRAGCPIVVRSTGLLETLRYEAAPPLIGDFSLNAANVLTAGIFLRLGLERITPAHDLNAAQIIALAGSIGAERMEVIAYHHLPVFHTEHCVFCRFLSTGTSRENCGRPCERYRVALRDAQGRAHRVMADVGCRNTVFGAEAQEAGLHLDGLRRAGIRHYRLEFVDESREQAARIARLFAAALTGDVPAGELQRQLRQLAPQGTTEGSLFVPEGYLALPEV